MKRRSPKTFVLDTNVLLHDSSCLDHFEENDLIIPIVVIEELDRFKRGNQEINQNARECLRRLDELTGDIMASDGVALGPGRGRVRVVRSGPPSDTVRSQFLTDGPDHRILDVALALHGGNPRQRTVLVTKDTNLRLKAKSLGVPAQDYKSDKVESFDRLYSGTRVVEDVPPDAIAHLHEQGTLPAREISAISAPIANENFVLRNGSASALATYKADSQNLVRVGGLVAYGVRPRNAEQTFAMRALLDDDVQLVTLLGKAGTGKTLIALAAALECRRRYRQILLARPIVPLSNRDLGYLPGDAEAKIDPYMRPLFDNLAVICGEGGEKESQAQKIATMREQEKLLITPLAYIRGRSLQRVYFIIDEAQNLTPHEVKTIITRAGEGTKVVLTGDIRQIDQPYLDSLSNGLSYTVARMVGQTLYAHVTLEKGERSKLADLASTLL
ncbi:MAG: PhoH family protein [Planctomycetota bacterium]